MRARQAYSESFRRDVLALVEKSDRTLERVALDLGLVPQTVRYWYNQAMAKSGKKRTARQPAKLPVGDPDDETVEAKIRRLEAENAELRRKNDALEQDRAILKKAAAFFAKESE
jgi:transposase